MLLIVYFTRSHCISANRVVWAFKWIWGHAHFFISKLLYCQLNFCHLSIVFELLNSPNDDNACYKWDHFSNGIPSSWKNRFDSCWETTRAETYIFHGTAYLISRKKQMCNTVTAKQNMNEKCQNHHMNLLFACTFEIVSVCLMLDFGYCTETNVSTANEHAHLDLSFSWLESAKADV